MHRPRRLSGRAPNRCSPPRAPVSRLSSSPEEHAHTDALRHMGGDQKFLPLYKYPHLAAATAGMNEGDLSDIIELPGGLQIFQYLGRREAIPATYEVAAIQIRALLAEASRTETKTNASSRPTAIRSVSAFSTRACRPHGRARLPQRNPR